MGRFLLLLRAQALRERWQVAFWVLGIALLCFGASAAVAAEFGQEAERAAIVAVAAANPAFLFLRGSPDGTGIGAVVFFQGFAFTAVLAGLMGTFLVVRHTRADEERGRAELTASAPLPRAAQLGATLCLGAGACALLAALSAAGFAAGGLPWPGAGLAGGAVGAVGLFFVAVAALLAQLLPTARAANGAAAAGVGAAYLLRGIGDALGTPDRDLARVEPAWPSLLSPIGWGQRTTPFSSPDPLPLLVPLGAALLVAALALAVRAHRDLGASLVPVRSGRPRAAPWLCSFAGVAWRMHRAPLAGWAAGAAALGAIAGGFGPVAAGAVAGNDSLAELIGRLVPGSRAGVVDVFTAALLGMAGIFAAAAGVQAVLRMRTEEMDGRAELLLSVPRSRARWCGANVLVAALSATAVSAAAGAAAAAALLASGDGSRHAAAMVPAALAHVPAALVVTAAAALAVAVFPLASIPLGWGILVAALVLGQFGELLRLPGWLRSASPFAHSSALPVEDLDATAALVMLAVAALAAGASAGLLRARDLAP